MVFPYSPPGRKKIGPRRRAAALLALAIPVLAIPALVLPASSLQAESSAAGEPVGDVAAEASAAEPGWSDLADLVLASPAIVVATIADARRLSSRDAPDVAPGEVRVLVRAGLTAALRAPDLLPARAEWQWQGAPAARGRPPFARGDRVIAFLQPVPGGGTDLQRYRLVSAQAQLAWTPEREAAVRAILVEAVDQRREGLLVTGISDAFRTEGDVAGNSESQFFLSTRSGRPLTLTVTRAPGSEPQVRLATGDLIDRGQPVAPRTLPWHALACGLPDQLPANLAEKPGLAEDYAFARQSLGPCGRRLGRPA